MKQRRRPEARVAVNEHRWGIMVHAEGRTWEAACNPDYHITYVDMLGNINLAKLGTRMCTRCWLPEEVDFDASS